MWWSAAAKLGLEHKPTISFDFDDVLHYAPGGNPINFWEWESWVPREPYVSELRRLADEGHRIIIVSHRDPGMEGSMEAFAEAHDLPVDAIYCVGIYGSKLRALEDEDARTHYDDSPAVASELRGSGVELIEVPRTDEYDLSWVPEDVWVRFPEIYGHYADMAGLPRPA